MNNRKRVSFELTLAGVSSAVAVIFLLIAYYAQIGALAFYALAGLALCLPLYVESLRSTLLAYVVSSILGIVFTNYIFAMPFVLIFGLHIVISALCAKYLKKKWYFTIPIKIVFVNIALLGVFYICGLNSIFTIMERIGMSAKYLWIALIATPLFVGYDYLIQRVYSFFGRRLNKFFSKYRPPKAKKFEKTIENNQETELPPDDDNPFSDL